jgi:hypothetical protein
MMHSCHARLQVTLAATSPGLTSITGGYWLNDAVGDAEQQHIQVDCWLQYPSAPVALDVGQHSVCLTKCQVPSHSV